MRAITSIRSLVVVTRDLFNAVIILNILNNKKRWSLFEPKRDEVTGDWRKLHTEELHSLYSSPSIVRMIKSRVVHVAQMGEKRNAYRLLVGKPEGKRPLGRPRRRWVYNIKMK
jgi:hypothetical protein